MATKTLLEIKTLFWRYMGQLWTGTATSGSASTLVDPNLVDLGSEEFPTPLEGKQLRITSIITDLRRIAKVDHATGTLYPNAVFSSALTTNTYEVWGSSINGGDALTRLFNDVLQVARPLAQTELTIVTGQHIYDATALVSDPADIVEVYTRAIDSASLVPYTPVPVFWWQVLSYINTEAYGVALEIYPAQTLSTTTALFVEHYKKLADFTTDTSTVDATYAEWLAWEAVLRHALDKGLGSADKGRWADLAGRAGANVREYRRRFMPIKTRRAMHGRPQVM